MKSIALPRALGALVAIALALRLAPIIAHAGRPLVGDELSFDGIAWNVASGHGYSFGITDAERHPTALRGPSYVLLLAACYRLAGHAPVVPLALQALLDVLSLLLVHRLALRWFRRPSVALVAAGIYALYPPFIIDSVTLITETFVQFMLLTTVSLFFDFLERGSVGRLAGSAVALGLCALAKPQLAPIGVLLCLVAAPRIGMARALRAAAMVVAVTGLMMSPWIVRNAIVFKRFVPGLSMGGTGLWFGSGPIDGRLIGGLADPGVPDSLRRAVNGMGELGADRWAYGEAGRLIAAHPGRYARLTVTKFFRLWFNIGYEHAPSRASLAAACFNLAAIALALLGARRGGADGVARAFVAWLAVFWTVVHVPFVAVVRYAIPYYAVLFTFTAGGVVELFGRVRSPGGGRPSRHPRDERIAPNPRPARARP